MYKSNDRFELITYLVIAIVLACSVGIASYASKDEVTFTVSDKERVITEDASYYLVFTDKGVFKNGDAYWQLKFSSSTLQGKLVNGETFTCTKNFWRVPFLSWYENLLTCNKQ